MRNELSDRARKFIASIASATPSLAQRGEFLDGLIEDARAIVDEETRLAIENCSQVSGFVKYETGKTGELTDTATVMLDDGSEYSFPVLKPGTPEEREALERELLEMGRASILESFVSEDPVDPDEPNRFPCCATMYEAFIPGFDNTAGGSLMRTRTEAEGGVEFSYRLPPVQFCPWCGKGVPA